MKKSTFFAFFITCISAAPLKADTLMFGIVPQQSADKMAKNWGPVIQELSRETGLDIKFTTASNIPEFEKRLLNGEYDIAYMNPYHFTVFNKRPGYQAIAKQKDKKIKGIIVAPVNSDIDSIHQLNGKTLSFPSEAAFAASILPRAELKKLNIHFTPQYVSSHDSVYLTVSRGIFPAGGGVLRTLNNTDPDTKSKLKILWNTKGYTPHAIAAHPDLDLQKKEKIQKALIQLSKTHKDLLAKINFKEIEEAKNSDWDDVRSLDIKLLDHLIK